ncbi:MAG TPA: S9 family peptidase [Kofleriaceae bacterium]|nr:S9 family peptidase [Kofleriaceae bacterium]
MGRLHAAHLAALAATSTAGLGGLGALVITSCAGAATGPREPTSPPAASPPAAGYQVPVGKPSPPPAPTGPVPPVAEQRPHKVESPFGARNDPYYWLRDDSRKDPAVLAYLSAENAYSAAVMGPAAALEQTLLGELRARIKEDDATVPVLDDGYWYYSRYETGKQYPIHARKKGALTAPEEVLLDGNQLAVGHAFFAIGGYRVSRDGRLIAWGEDTVGRNQFTLRVKDLKTGALLPDTATNISPSLAWANDHKTLFYVGKDPTTLRTDRVFRHVLGGKSELIYKEDDGQYYVGVSTTKSRRYIVVGAGATTNTELRLIDADRPASAPKVFLPREKDHLYELDHLDGRFVMRTNADAKNFRIVEIAPGKEASRKAWKDLVPHSPDVLVEDVALYHGFLAVSVRTGGLRKVRVLPKGKPAFFLDAPDAAYAMTVLDTPDADAKRVRFSYDALTTPRSVFEADVATKERKLLKQQPVPTFDPTRYASEYLHATAKDGTQVPISVAYRKDTPRDGTAPVLVYGYGSYGLSMEPWFNSMAVSLLDRGWVFAVAHVRGGQEMGRAWYEDGKLMKKMNTFTDFIAVTEHLVAQRYGKPDQVFALGGSAGGLLMGAIVNLRPELFRGIVAQVPFVDVVTTMLDESIPLTTNEFDEWGNPKSSKEVYEYMLAYSPYDNVRAAGYPSLLVQTGLWDSQVQYFEPAKWVARLRATKTDDNLLVMDVDMSSGHGGASGRFERLKQTARALAFMLHVRERPDRRAR